MGADATQAVSTVLHGSLGQNEALCDYCQQPFTPRVLRGPNKQRFCTEACKQEWHDKNPLERDGEFQLSLMNPNPSFRTRKDGDHYVISFEVSREEWTWFTDPNLNRQGMVIETMARVTHRNAPTPVSAGLYGKEARLLKQSAFFRSPAVWRALGTDEEYLAWLRELTCAFCHRDEVEAAHVRRIADGAGVGIKPEYSAIPLCHEHHALQHQQGESALGGKEWFDKKRIEYVSEWAWAQLKAELQVESMAEVSPDRIVTWALEHELTDYLPREFDVPAMLRKQAD